MQLTHNRNKHLLAILVLMVIPISGLSIDIYVPSLPAVGRYFNVDKSMVQLTITTYMLGLGAMQLFAGGLSDSFGRKKPFIIAMSIYILSTFLVPFSQDIYQLLFLRLIQGSTVALTVVPLRSVISDLYEGRDLQKMMNYMTMAWSIGPIIAPAIGGYLQHYFGWQSNFYFLGIYSIITFTILLFYMPETSVYRHPFHMGQMIKRYLHILIHREFFVGLITNGLLYSLIILFSIVGPFLIQSVLHYSAIQFGHISLLMGLAWFLGTVTNRFVLDIPVFLKAKICFWIMLMIALAMFSLVFLFPTNLYCIVVPMMMLLWVGGIAFPNYFMRSVTLFPKVSGSANALFGASVFFVAGLNSAFGTVLKSSTALPLAGAFVVIMLLCLVIYYVDKCLASRKAVNL